MAQAQLDQSQLVHPLGAADLNANLARLAANPRDVAALIGAGEAALALDDPRAAAGFYARADAIESGNGRIKAGLGRVMLKMQNPVEALRLFDQAQRLGYPDATILSDRGLAKDMTGDQAGAQRDYQAALQRTPNDDELVRRYAASLGISGQVAASDKILEPLLYKSDRAAWRYKAFILAMNNKQADAKKVAEQTMPAQLAGAITPYMQKMPYLTAAQKAAAVHFGHFPQQIGTSIAAITPTPPAPGIAVAKPVTVAAATPEKTKPLSRSEQRRQQREATRKAREERLAAARRPAQTPPAQTRPAQTQVAQAATRPPVPQPTRQPILQQPTPQPSRSAPAPQVQPLPSDERGNGAQTRTETVPLRPGESFPSAAMQGPPAPGFESIQNNAPRATPPQNPPAGSGSQPNAIALAQAPTSPTPATASPQPAPAATTPSAEASPAPVTQSPAAAQQPDPEMVRTLADIIRAIDVPEAERQASVAAVDLNEVATIQATRRAERQAAAKAAADKAKKDAAAKVKAEADAKAKAAAEEKKRLAANPSRNWLQVGVGQSKGALGFTMKGLRKKYTILAPQGAWSASWGRTNRLLVGPFASFTRAKELETSLKKDGADVFAWRSEAGEEVEKLAGE
ncbi:SPOR domain-containing protein [Sphingobium limneticum]|uniref:SPOR domain-containing protein n=2 Tax=Sphingobium limneticum TaxID=1007511 RepID=A0A5J5I1X9_9SPHN|nr:SPOR domain-containing protein [Sphingobium limneticum]KAA9016911.1 SPOR domain-containing protein [Sphingobium limneticum]KAA9029890.1 SPOR domain-containing protein [Sphingobium limneticum]